MTQSNLSLGVIHKPRGHLRGRGTQVENGYVDSILVDLSKLNFHYFRSKLTIFDWEKYPLGPIGYRKLTKVTL